MKKKVLTKKEVGEVKDLIKPKEVIKKEVALSWDGNNIMIRLPKEIADYFKINKKNRFEKMFLFELRENPDGTIKKTFDFIKREKPKRKKNVKKKITNRKL